MVSIARLSDPVENGIVLDQLEENIFFQFILAGDQNIEQLKDCCIDQLKQGVFVTRNNLVNEMGTLILEPNAFFFSIVTLEGKNIEKMTYNLYFDSYTPEIIQLYQLFSLQNSFQNSST